MSPRQRVRQQRGRTDAPGVRATAMPEGGVIEGIVSPGDQRGRTLGFPTANLVLDSESPIRDGVWTGVAVVDGTVHPAAISIGHRPTYYDRDGVRLLEAHLLDFRGDLYGRRLEVHLHEHLRPQRRFAGSVDLVRQLHDDIRATREWVAREATTAIPSLAMPAAGDRRVGAVNRRRVRQQAMIAAAVNDAHLAGELSHERVAALADVPLGLLRWLHPSEQSLHALVAAD